MARGWESKSVEDQKSEAEANRDAQIKPHFSAVEREQRARRESLLLSRTQIINRLNATQNARYRAQLESALKHLDDELREFDQMGQPE
jgi:hypothetical protein